MQDLTRLRRTGEDALRLLVDLLPDEWDPRSGQEYVTLVFADVEGFSTHVAEAGDDGALAVLAALDRAVDAALANRVRVVKRLGDGLMLAGRRPGDAVLTAVDLVGGFDEAIAEEGLHLRLRAGAHRGTVHRQGADYVGYHVNLAARVAEAARGGQVLATANALAGLDLADLGVHTSTVGRLRGKGVNGPVELFAVGWEPFEEEGPLQRIRRLLGL